MKKWIIIIFINSTLFGFISPGYAAEPINTVPGALTVGEDTLLKVSGITISDPDGNLAEVQLSVTRGVLNVTPPTVPPPVPPFGIVGNGTNRLTITGTEIEINTTLGTLSFEGNKNYYGFDSLTVVSSDSASPPGKDTDIIDLTITNGVAANRVCDWRSRPAKTVNYSGDLHKNLSVGTVASYSLIRYNLADKKSSFNAKAAGFGFSFRTYTNGDLADFGVTSIKQVPAECRAQTEDLLNSKDKVISKFSFAPTFYVFQEANADDLGTQIALNFGFFNDIVSLGVGWNLSGEDAGEWFILFGPSFGFQF